jgi:predicted O-methyltransferase YrrM
MGLNEYLKRKGLDVIEGYSQQVPRQLIDLIKLTSKPNINVMEIGFNAGHSAEVFLKNNPTLMLTSFDIGIHQYVKHAKKYIDDTYPNRHTLILGDSTISIPKYINNTDKKYDIIFIDGGHEYDIAKADLNNCMKLAHKDTIVILDDTMYKVDWVAKWTIGPTKAWLECLKENMIVEINRKDYRPRRGMSWGKYIV